MGRETNEPTYPIDGTPTEQVAYISGLDERTIERLGGCEEQPPTRPVESTHHADCWRDHFACAGSLIERLTQQVGELSQDLAYSRCSTTHAATQRDELAVKHARARQDLRGVEAERDRLRRDLAAIEDECDCDGAPDARTNEHGDALGPHCCVFHRAMNRGPA